MKRPGIQYAKAAEHVCSLFRQQVDEYAARVASQLRFQPGADITVLIGTLGGRIHYVDLLDSPVDEDTIFVHAPHDFDIILSSISSPYRDRFTIAHELGHYLLHSRQGEIPLVAARNGFNRAEWEANWFAAGLLMPAAEFRTAHEQGKRSFELAAQFAVSQSAAEIRMKVLALA